MNLRSSGRSGIAESSGGSASSVKAPYEIWPTPMTRISSVRSGTTINTGGNASS